MSVEKIPDKGNINKRTFSVLYYAITALVVALIAVGSFFGGAAYQKEKNSYDNLSSDRQPGQSSRFGGGQRGSTMGGMRGEMGTVIAVSDTSITVKTTNYFRQQTQETGEDNKKTFTIDGNTKITSSGKTIDISGVKQNDTVFIEPDSSDETKAAKINIGGFGSRQEN